jgi:hypothetical protein
MEVQLKVEKAVSASWTVVMCGESRYLPIAFLLLLEILLRSMNRRRGAHGGLRGCSRAVVASWRLCCITKRNQS